MKLNLYMLLFVITQVIASFSSELRNAVMSVENSFGKLLTDVVTDVRDTITCTVMAIEEAFSNDLLDNSSDYYKKCGGTPTNAASSKLQKVPSPNSTNTQNGNTSQQIEPSITKENKLLESHDAPIRLEKVKSILDQETSRLADVTRILKQELDNISENIRKRFNKFTFNENNPSVENVWGSIKALHEIEQENKNTPEAKHITQVIDKVIIALNIKDSPEKSNNDKIGDIMSNIKSSSHEPQLVNIEKKLDDIKPANTSKNIPRTFKEVAKKIIDEKPVIVQTIPTTTEHTLITTTRAPASTSFTTQKTAAPQTDNTLDDDPFLQFSTSNKNEQEQAVRRASKIIEDSKRSQMILDNLFKKSNNNAKNVFEDPNSFKFT